MDYSQYTNSDQTSNYGARPGFNRLTWINYADPVQERKAKDNKTIVRTAAKLSTLDPRAKPKVNKSRARARKPSNQFRSENPNDHAIAFVTPWIHHGNSDPFDSLPTRTTSLSFSLLNRYCESLHIQPECSTSCPRTQSLRRRYLLPTLVQSKGTLNVALLFLGRKWTDDKLQQHRYQRETILEVQKALRNPTALIPIEMFLMIGKLITAASHQGDTFAVSTHYKGMAQLFMHHWASLARHPLFVLGIFAFWSSPSSLQNSCCQHQPSPRIDTDRSLPLPNAFLRLYASGLISRSTLDAIPDLLHLCQLISSAKAGTLTADTAQDLLRLKWACSSHFHTLAGTTPVHEFERSLQLTLQLSLTLCVNHTLPAVGEHYAPAIMAQLADMEVEVLERAPEALLWVVLVVGSGYHTEEGSDRVAVMLRLVAGYLGITKWEDALLLVTQFIWTEEFDGQGREFWKGAMLGSSESS